MIRAAPKGVRGNRGGQPKEERLVTLKSEDWTEAVEALHKHGIVVLRGLLSPEQVQDLRSQLGVQGSALDRYGSRSSKDVHSLLPIREFSAETLIEKDPEIEPVTSTAGRQHFYLRGGPVEKVVKHVQAGAMPLVWEHLASAMPMEEQHPWISELQMLVTEPCAVDQFWHMDNASPGLTLYVPLTDVPENLGPMLFLPGSHHLLTSDGLATRVQRFLGSFLSSNGLVVGKLAAGDALIHNSAIFHRGSRNRCYDRSCVALVFRYDFERPPGIGAFTAQLVSFLGSALAGMQRCYGAIPGPAEASGKVDAATT
jgi:ectoine hydroxylase-related dioxygenase (phytanoyl-CoA dioxygenase family)